MLETENEEEVVSTLKVLTAGAERHNHYKMTRVTKCAQGIMGGPRMGHHGMREVAR